MYETTSKQRTMVNIEFADPTGLSSLIPFTSSVAVAADDIWVLAQACSVYTGGDLLANWRDGIPRWRKVKHVGGSTLTFVSESGYITYANGQIQAPNPLAAVSQGIPIMPGTVNVPQLAGATINCKVSDGTGNDVPFYMYWNDTPGTMLFSDTPGAVPNAMVSPLRTSSPIPPEFIGDPGMIEPCNMVGPNGASTITAVSMNATGATTASADGIWLFQKNGVLTTMSTPLIFRMKLNWNSTTNGMPVIIFALSEIVDIGAATIYRSATTARPNVLPIDLGKSLFLAVVATGTGTPVANNGLIDVYLEVYAPAWAPTAPKTGIVSFLGYQTVTNTGQLSGFSMFAYAGNYQRPKQRTKIASRLMTVNWTP